MQNFKASNRNTKKRSEICSELTINTPERSQWRISSVSIGDFEFVCSEIIKLSEVATRGLLLKKLFLKISEYLLENTCVGVFFFNKAADLQLH